jgi:hypothetical protein
MESGNLVRKLLFFYILALLVIKTLHL